MSEIIKKLKKIIDINNAGCFNSTHNHNALVDSVVELEALTAENEKLIGLLKEALPCVQTAHFNCFVGSSIERAIKENK